MGLSQVTAGFIAKRGNFILEKFKYVGLVKTHSTKLITDSAAGATAMATGSKTYNGAISVDTAQKPLKTIIEFAEEYGWGTGIVTTATVTHATPACFYGHQKERRNVNRELAEEFLTKNIEVLMGGGWAYFKGGEGQEDLIEKAKGQGYHYAQSPEELPSSPAAKILCLVSPELPPRLSKRGNFLPLATEKSLASLDAHHRRFFLMIEGGQIDWGGHAKNSEYIVEEMLDFERAIERALRFAEEDGQTLVIVTADHETGGYSINGGSIKKGEVDGQFTTDYHTASFVPIFAYGPGAASFAGVFDNTEIFFKMKYLMGMK
jgi:alkaline phosphatase